MDVEENLQQFNQSDNDDNYDDDNYDDNDISFSSSSSSNIRTSKHIHPRLSKEKGGKSLSPSLPLEYKQLLLNYFNEEAVRGQVSWNEIMNDSRGARDVSSWSDE